MTRAVAVDWSGRRTGESRYIFVAEAEDGRLLRLEAGRTRGEVADHLLGVAGRGSVDLIGLDFAFAAPAWFMDEHGCSTAADLWALAAAGKAEEWLERCQAPFWGRPGRRRPPVEKDRPELRRCEAELRPRPRSVFQIGGAGAVGTGSLRGWPVLHRLRVEGLAVWPFDPSGATSVIEVWPRLHTPGLVKSRPAARAAFVAGWAEPFRSMAERSDDALDAAAAAMALSAAEPQLPAVDPLTAREGALWQPAQRPKTAKWRGSARKP